MSEHVPQTETYEPEDGEHASAAPAHHGGGGHGGDHGGGGHGGSWLVTYCDMITLLIAFFICILTFASKESGKHSHRKMRDSVLYGPEGTGVAGDKVRGGDQDSLVWRDVLLSAIFQRSGSPIPPVYADPVPDPTTRTLRLLEQQTDVTLGKSYELRLPAALLFASGNRLSPSGETLLKAVAGGIRALPFDLYVQVEDSSDLPRAVALAVHLTRREGLRASRVGVGVREVPEGEKDSVWLLLARKRGV